MRIHVWSIVSPSLNMKHKYLFYEEFRLHTVLIAQRLYVFRQHRLLDIGRIGIVPDCHKERGLDEAFGCKGGKLSYIKKYG